MKIWPLAARCPPPPPAGPPAVAGGFWRPPLFPTGAPSWRRPPFPGGEKRPFQSAGPSTKPPNNRPAKPGPRMPFLPKWKAAPLKIPGDPGPGENEAPTARPPRPLGPRPPPYETRALLAGVRHRGHNRVDYGPVFLTKSAFLGNRFLRFRGPDVSRALRRTGPEATLTASKK